MNKNDFVLNFSSIQDVDTQQIYKKLEEHHFCLLRGLISREMLSSGMKNLQNFIADNDDRACTGESPSEVRDYFMKLSIGLGNHSGHQINRGRFMRTIYIPLNKPDRFGLVDCFKTVGKVRNLLMRKNREFAIEEPEEGLWTAARVHHFPTGGGHMVPHRDTLAPQIVTEANEKYDYYQPILIMSRKGIDYDIGGGCAMLDGKLTEYEDFSEFGDIAIYNSSTIHGVNEIDLHKPFRQRSSTGRYSGLATLYKTNA